MLNPVLKRLDKSKQKELEMQIQKQFDPVDVCIICILLLFYIITLQVPIITLLSITENLLQKEVGEMSSSDRTDSEDSVYSSDDDQNWTKQLKSEYRQAKKRRITTERIEHRKSENNNYNGENVHDESTIKPPKFYEIKDGEEMVQSNINQATSTQNSR